MFKVNSKNTNVVNVVLKMFDVNIRVIDIIDVVCFLIVDQEHVELIKPFQSSIAFHIETS